jgi:hypothetical protein
VTVLVKTPPLRDRLDDFDIAEGKRLACVVAPWDTTMRDACLRLRRDFQRRAGWSILGTVPDRYDDVSLHLAVVREDGVVATLRSTPPQPHVGFMLEHEFASLVDPAERLRCTPSSLEVSGLATAPGAPPERLADVMLLFRLWARVALATHATDAYFVVEEGLLARFETLQPAIHRFVHGLGAWKRFGGDRPSRAMRLDMMDAARQLSVLAPPLAELVFR